VTNTPPPNANAAQQRTAPRETRTNENLTKGSTSKGTRKRSIWIKRRVHRGEGLNDWLYGRAFHLAMERATPQSVAAALHGLVGDEARPGEIRRQVERAFRAAGANVGRVGSLPPRPATPKWPEPDQAALVRVWEDHPATVDELAALSPFPAPEHPLDVLRVLHGAHDDAFLCLGETPAGRFYTRTFSQWERHRDAITSYAMTVPNLMRTAAGMNDEGRPSARCRDNSCGQGGQQFLVVELDLCADAPVVAELGARPVDVCAAVILHKIGLQQVRMVVSSGGKSLHAWLPAGGRTQEQIKQFYRVWRRFAADWRGSLPEQQFRLPQGFRADKGARQAVVYVYPEGAH
jgi:hypothetical protein